MANRWRIKIIHKGAVKQDLRNQTGNQLRKIRNAWAQEKKTQGSQYFGTELKFEAEPDLKNIK
jgi:hypothetical protein